MLCKNKRLLLLCFSTVVTLILLWHWRIDMTKSLNSNMNQQEVNLFDLNKVPILCLPTCSSSVGNKGFKIDVANYEGPIADILVIIHSGIGNFNKRRNIRHTWGRAEALAGVKIMFIVGSSNNQTTQGKAMLEAHLFKDILVAGFTDHYRNLSYKNILGLKYVSQFMCHKPRLIIKADDDFFYDLYAISHYFYNNLAQDSQFLGGEAIACPLITKSRVFRDFSPSRVSKWAVSEDDLPSSRLRNNKYYPLYCHGCLYLLTPATARKLLKFVEQEPHYISVDDAWITGLVAKEATIAHIVMENVLTFNSNTFLQSKKQQSLTSYHPDLMVGPMSVSAGFILQSRSKWCWIHKCKNNIYNKISDRNMTPENVASQSTDIPD